MVLSRLWTTGSTKQGSLREGKRMWWALRLSQLIAQRIPGCSAGQENSNRAWQPRWADRTEWRTRGSHSARMCVAEQQREESCLESRVIENKSSRDLQKVYLECLAEYYLVHAFEQITLKLEKELAEMNGQSNPWSSHKRGIHLAATRQGRQISWYMEHQVKYSDEITSVLRGKISSRLIKILSKPPKDQIVYK